LAAVIARSAATKQSRNRAGLLRCARNDIGKLMSLPPFHLAFPVDDLAAARDFYGRLLGCPEGRSAEHWVDFDFLGHQIVAHLAPGAARARATNPVDGEAVPVPHFGAVLPMAEWQALADRLTASGTEFVIPPTVRFAGEPGEQATMFLLDPAGNALEFKAMADPANLFAKS
jgi:extradiol dioxygenase family protein